MRIEDYGLIGDMQTAALVGRNGAVDWLCLPRFDSPSCFTALLGDEMHGRWLLAPSGEVRASARRYRAGTLVLETDFETAEGAVRVIDFMPRRREGPPRLMRIVEGLRGRVPMQMELSLRPDYASIVPWVEAVPDGSLPPPGRTRFVSAPGWCSRLRTGRYERTLSPLKAPANGSRSRGTCRMERRHQSRTPTRRSRARRRGSESGADAAPTTVAIGTRY